MKITIRRAGKIVWNHILAIILAIFCAYVFGWLFLFSAGEIVLGIITTCIYIALIYSTAWNFGRLDSRKLPGNEPNIKKAISFALIATIPALIFLGFRIVSPLIFNQLYFNYSIIIPVIDISDIIYRVWMFPCLIFFGDGSRFPAYILPIFIIPVFSTLGYIVGLTRFSVIEKIYPKIIYKREKKL